MSVKVYLASSNQNKSKEINALMESKKLILESAPHSLEVEETGESFRENALIKARAYYEEFQSPCLSDDSGLELIRYPEKLGIYSARFEPDLSYEDKCEAILKSYEEDKQTDRRAYFVCFLCLYLSPEEIYFFEGRVHGLISEELRGSGGFGYDPIFVPEGETRTFAEDQEMKERHSHRAKAVRAMDAFVRDYSFAKQ